MNNFYPRPPRGGRPPTVACALRPADFYPRPPRGGRLFGPFDASKTCNISIHALREEGDGFLLPGFRKPGNFYPRPPRGGRLREMLLIVSSLNFYPRPPRGGRQLKNNQQAMFTSISIHALREEGDTSGLRTPPTPMKFLSTPSARRATRADCGLEVFCAISIHALREEGDRVKRSLVSVFSVFLSTPSARRATTQQDTPQKRCTDFYPRPPRGGRRQQYRHKPHGRNFYPRPPRGGRPAAAECTSGIRHISIHALREEGDRDSTN